MSAPRKRPKLLKPLDADPHVGCLNCAHRGRTLPLAAKIAVGFGDAHLERDGEIVWQEARHEWDECLTVRRAENMAAKDPKRDWRIVLDGPLHGETYQRHGPKSWVLVKRNEGFA